MRRIFMLSVVVLAGCYASEKVGKDIQDTSHDVNQGGIHMDHGALGVRRPVQTTTLTSAPAPTTKSTAMPASAAAPPVATAAVTSAPAAAPPPAVTAPAPPAPAAPPVPAPPNGAAPPVDPSAMSL